jgi:ribosomal protein S18 acetylase RimI-like enzyme
VEGVPMRAARRGDVPSLLELWAAMMEESAALDPRLAPHSRARAHMAEQFAAWLQDPSRAVLVAEEGGRLVVGYAAGCVGAGSGFQAPAEVGQITDCFVVPPRRRRGVARRLVSRLCDVLYERGAGTVRLQVACRNPEALAFWGSLGFEALEHILERPVLTGV